MQHTHNKLLPTIFDDFATQDKLLHFNFLVGCSIAKVFQHWILRIKWSEETRGISSLETQILYSCCVFMCVHCALHTRTQNCYWNLKFFNELFCPGKAWIYRHTSGLNVWWEEYEEENRKKGVKEEWEMDAHLNQWLNAWVCKILIARAYKIAPMN